MVHIPVLLNPVLDLLDFNSYKTYVDATVGGAGHSSAIMQRAQSNACLFAFDQDDYALHQARKKLQPYSKQCTFIHDNFLNIPIHLAEYGVKQVDAFLFDLGVSSFQLDDRSRGFSYHDNNPLDMRMNREQTLTAAEIINTYSFEELRDIFWKYGEERRASAIARKICLTRQTTPITSTYQFVEIIKSVMTVKELFAKKHPARKTFQALRIAVNKELQVLPITLQKAMNMLAPHGILIVLTFHSLEDRIVKEIFLAASQPSREPLAVHKLLRVSNNQTSQFMTNKQFIVASETEKKLNPRARSAKLRFCQKK